MTIQRVNPIEIVLGQQVLYRPLNCGTVGEEFIPALITGLDRTQRGQVVAVEIQTLEDRKILNTVPNNLFTNRE